MMQFSDPSSIEKIESFGKYYGDAVLLAEFIDDPAPLPSFEDRLTMNRAQFPKFVAHCDKERPFNIHEMSVSQRLELKNVLLDELRSKVEKSKEEIGCAKMIGDIALPSDPRECSSKLGEMIKHATTEDVEAYRDALYSSALLSMTLNKHTIEVYDESPFLTSTPRKRARIIE